MFEDPHYHLIVNHFPLMALFLGILIMIAGFISRNEIIKATALGVFILAALSVYIAMSSGESAEEAVEHLPGFDNKVIHEHEEQAANLARMLYTLGLLSVIALWSYGKKKVFYNGLCIAALVFSCIGTYFSYQVGTSGGIIHHQEIREKSEIGAELPD